MQAGGVARTAALAGQSTPGVVPATSTYFDASQLTELPRPLAEPALAALEEKVSAAGEVRMTLYIDASGQVTAIDVRSTTLPTEVAAEAAAIFSHVPFAPGRIGPNAVRSRVGLNLGVASRQSYAR